MCGRYHLRAKREDILKHFDLIEAFDIHGPVNRSEIFPGQPIMTIGNNRNAVERFWTIIEPDNKGDFQRVINARSETATKVGMFKKYFFSDRCLIPATGFFEWTPSRERRDFTFDDPIVAFGGLSRPSVVKGSARDCVVMLTTKANEVVFPIHAKHRMPVIIRRQDYLKWIDPETNLSELRMIMQPWSAAETHEVPAPSRLPVEPEVTAWLNELAEKEKTSV